MENRERTIGNLAKEIARSAGALFSHRYRHVALVLLLDVVLTAVFFTIVQNQQQAHTQAEFERQAETYVAAIQKGIERNLEVIESIGGLYAASGKVERDDFRKFVQGPLSRHQEIQALSWNERVSHSERRQFEASVRQEGYPEFQFKGWGLDDPRVVAIERPEYIVVTYIEPYEGNQAAMGLDVASNPTRLAALESARDTGEMITTARITLVQETGEQYGFLILKPIYETPAAPETVEGRRQNLKGFAVGVFRVGDMVEAALGDLPKGIVNIQLVDEASPADAGLLYLGQASDSANPAGQEQLKARGELYLREPLEIPGRQWSVLLTPTSKFLGGQASWEAWGVLAGGLFITILLVVYLLSMARHTARIQRLVVQVSKTNEELETEKTQREAAQGYSQNLIDSSLDMIISVDRERRIVEFNRAAQDVFGYNEEEVIGKHIDMLYKEPTEGVDVHNRTLETGERATEVVNVRKNGETFPSFLSASILRDVEGETLGVMSVSRDITERKRAEEALVYQAHLLENVNDAVIASDERFVTTAWNRAAEEMYGWSAEEIIGRPTVEFLQPEFVDVEPDEVFRRLLEEGSFEGEVIHPRKDGTRIHTEARSIALRNQDGHITGFVSVDRDITERKRAEEDLRESEGRFRSLVEHAGDAIFLHTADGTFIDVNQQACDSLGYTRQQLLNLSLVDIAGDSSVADMDTMLRQLDIGTAATLDAVHRRKDGTTFPVEVRILSAWRATPRSGS